MPKITFSNYRVQYIAPTQPEHTFEPSCAILADWVDGNCLPSTVRVFDVPDPDEDQRAVAAFACKAMENYNAVVEALARIITAYDGSRDAPSARSAMAEIRSAVEPAREILAAAR